MASCFALGRKIEINEWLKNMNKGVMNGILFLDLKKAFDTVKYYISS